MLNLVGARNANKLISINVVFFMSLLGWQSMLALFLAAFIGPGQVSPDLANNALSLYLARPFSRVEYVLGKMSVLVILLSLMTWVPGLLLFGLQGYLEGWQWMQDHMRFAVAMFVGAWIWILILSLLALALSAWVKWKPAAGALMFGVFFVARRIRRDRQRRPAHQLGAPVQHQLPDRLGLGAACSKAPTRPPTERSSSARRSARSCRCGVAGPR